MKHGKRPTREQMKLLQKRKLKPEDWLVVKDTPEQMELVHRHMIEAIWNALDFWQRCGVIVLAVAIPVGIVIETIANRDIYLAEKRRGKK